MAEVDPGAEHVKLEPSQWGDILVVPDEEWDLAFYDVLAHYVSDEKMSDLYVLLNGIKPGGLAFIRDIGQLKEMPHDRQRTIDTTQKDQRLTDFQNWLQNEIGFHAEIGDLHLMVDNFFRPSTVHGYRGDYLTEITFEMVNRATNNRMVADEIFYFYPEGSTSRLRYFINLMMTKKE